MALYRCPGCKHGFVTKATFLEHARMAHGYHDGHYEKVTGEQFDEQEHDSLALGVAIGLGLGFISPAPDVAAETSAVEPASSFEGGGGDFGGGGSSGDFSGGGSGGGEGV